jgi:peptide/nickel transport system substrate-binding protein
MAQPDFRLTRREFLRRVGIVGGAAAALQILGACGAPAAQQSAPSAGAATSAPEQGAPSAGAAKAGGELRFGQNNEPDTLDPARTAQSSAFTVMMNIYDTLVWMDPADLQFKPGLAESWESSPDGLMHTFKLRQGVTFHDGTPLNAEAVKFSFDRVTDPALKSPTALGKLGPYQETKVLDEHTAQVILKAPYPGFFDSISQTWLGIVSPAAVKKYGEDFGRNPVGTGFMKFAEWVAKDHITVERNAAYNWGPPFWNHSGPAYLERITFVPIADNGARMTAFESGDLAIIESVPEQDFDRLRQSGAYQMKVSPSQGGPMAFFMNTQLGPTADINVRKAILHGLGRKQLIDTALFGLYDPAEGPLSPNTLFYSKKVEGMYPYDTAKAQALLEQAGWKLGADGVREKDGQKLSIDFVNWPAAQPMVIATQGLLQPLGIQVNVKIFDQATRVQMGHNGEGHLFSTGLLDSEPGGIQLLYHSKNIGSFNWARYKDAELDTLLEQQATETDTAKRGALFERIQMKIMENALIYPAYVFARLHAVSSSVKDFRVNALGSYPYFYEMSLA